MSKLIAIVVCCLVMCLQIAEAQWEPAFRLNDVIKVDLEKVNTAALVDRACIAVFHPNKPFVFVGRSDGEIHVFDCESEVRVSTLKSRKSPVLSIEVSANMKEILIALHEDGVLDIWDLKESRLVRSVTERNEYGKTILASARLAPDGRHVALGFGYRRAKVIGITDDVPEEECLDLNEVIRDKGLAALASKRSGGWIAWSPDGKLLAVDSGDELKIWNVIAKKPVHTLENLRGGLVSKQFEKAAHFAFSPDGRLFAYHSPGAIAGGTLKIISVSDGKEKFQYHSPEGSRFGVCSWSPDSRRLAIPLRMDEGHGPFVAVASRHDNDEWAAESLSFPLRNKMAHITSTAFSKDGRFLLGGRILSPRYVVFPASDYPKADPIWDVQTGEVVCELPSILGNGGEFSANDKYIAISGVEALIFKRSGK